MDIVKEYEEKSLSGRLSAYDQKYVAWSAISYDLPTLQLFLAEIANLRKIGEYEAELEILESILADQDQAHLLRLLNGDPTTDRLANIEKWARKAATEMLTEGKYSFDTFDTISRFPLADYGLVVKRCQELVNLISDVTTQAERPTGGMPGV